MTQRMKMYKLVFFIINITFQKNHSGNQGMRIFILRNYKTIQNISIPGTDADEKFCVNTPYDFIHEKHIDVRSHKLHIFNARSCTDNFEVLTCIIEKLFDVFK